SAFTPPSSRTSRHARGVRSPPACAPGSERRPPASAVAFPWATAARRSPRRATPSMAGIHRRGRRSATLFRCLRNPAMSVNLPHLRLKKGEERRLRHGHPWIYSNQIDTTATPLSGFEAGQLVRVHDARDELVG